jgi:uncharacterized protein with von Willebrand factor type A (vWA) domain
MCVCVRACEQKVNQVVLWDRVLRSPEAPEETRGLTRSGDLGRMLPSETQLLALARPSADGARPPLPVARRLLLARRVERALLSYERSGWAPAPSRVTHGAELRPAQEAGPILLCLDTSGSMAGAREAVAKAAALECMRQARQQRRPCHVYAFSGPGDCVELELSLSAGGLEAMLAFLAGSFHGGTDVDEPLRRCLARSAQREWANADVLLVTDGELPPPDELLLEALAAAGGDRGLRVHGLLVGPPRDRAGSPLSRLCTGPVTVFRAFDALQAAG